MVTTMVPQEGLAASYHERRTMRAMRAITGHYGSSPLPELT